ncbi:MAG: hypothetical protein ACLQD8_05250 [Thermoplasmata archaeon]
MTGKPAAAADAPGDAPEPDGHKPIAHVNLPKKLAAWVSSIVTEAQRAGLNFTTHDVEEAWVQAANSPSAMRTKSEAARFTRAQSIVEADLKAAAKKIGTGETSAEVTTFLAAPDGRLVEEILVEGSARFLVYTPKTLRTPERWATADEFKLGDVRYVPRPVSPQLALALTLADGVEEYGDLRVLISEAETLLFDIYDPGREEAVAKLWVGTGVCSWVLPELFGDGVERFAAILRIVGPSESGKKRALSAMRFILYRSLYFLKTLRVPSIIRSIDPWPGASLLLDEADVHDSGEASEYIEFLNARADGAVMPRYSTETGQVSLFHSFGISALALRKPYSDDGFNSRGIPLQAESTTRDIDLVPPKDWEVRARRLLRKLLLFRLRTVTAIRAGKVVLETRVELPQVRSHRIKEVFLTLAAVSKPEGPAVLDSYKAVAEELQRRLVVERAGTPEGLVLNVVYEAIDDGWQIEREDLAYFVHHTVERAGSTEVERKDEVEVLTLGYIRDRLGKAFSPSEINRLWRGLVGGSGSKQMRIGERKFRGVLLVPDARRLDRVFRRFVPEFTAQETKFPTQTTLDGEGGRDPPDGGGAAAGQVGQRGPPAPPAGAPVPPVPPVPPATYDPPSTLKKGGEAPK